MSIITMYVYLLSNDDIAAVNALNEEHQGDNPPMIVLVMDYGLGPCVETWVLDEPDYILWHDALDELSPLAGRTVTQIDYSSPF
jgi:hypothetical protein